MFSIRFIRIISPLVLFLLLSGLLPAQQSTARRSLDWTPVQFQRVGDQNVKVFHFRHAGYDLNPLLPNYYEAIKIGNYSGYRVLINNPEFRTADPLLTRNMKNLDEIPSEISVITQRASIRKVPYLQVSFIPLRRNPETGAIEMLTGFDLVLKPVAGPLKAGAATQREYAGHSVLSAGRWFRIRVNSAISTRITSAR